MPTKQLFVISDLHLGGKPGFQICSPKGRELVADFLKWIASQAEGGQDVHLVVNGDLVDFLAEPPFATFTGDDDTATTKLQSILDSSPEIWKAFREIVKAGAELTVLLGNHDLELTLPGPSHLLRKTFGPGRVNFLFDNQALDLGDVLIEHGNRYDAWNVVDHDALRRFRSAVSRRESKDDFPTPAGSRLVIDVMNKIKQQLSFVDLLKPENDAVLPLIAALSPISRTQIRDVATYARQMKTVRYGPGQIPLDQGNIAYDGAAAVPAEPGAALADALVITGNGTDGGDIAFGDHLDFFKLWWASGNPARRAQLIEYLYQAFQHRVGPQRDIFTVDRESPEYVTAAESSATNGFKLILYGHTHLAKRVSVAGGFATYLNTGTWADLMMMPRGILGPDKELATRELGAFVADLENNRLDHWRTQLPTFARVEMEGRRLIAGDIHVYEGAGKSHPVANGLLEPLVVDAVSQTGV